MGKSAFWSWEPPKLQLTLNVGRSASIEIVQLCRGGGFVQRGN